jgi:glucokinase
MEATPRSAAVEVLAIDIGGSGVRGARVSEDGVLGRRAAQSLDPSLDAREISGRLHAVVSALETADDVAVGVAFPGFLDGEGRIRPGIHLRSMVGMDLAKELAAGCKERPVAVLPDLGAVALGEAHFGNRGERLLCVGLGSGANAALVVDGAVVDLAGGCLGDAGHVVVEPEGPACPCGGRGCLEAVCSGTALAREGAPLGLPDGVAVTEAAHQGRPEALALLERAGRGLGRALASWAAMTFPDRVVVVGGVSAAGELLLGPARRELDRVGQPTLVGELTVETGSCGSDAALLGAAFAAVALAESAQSDSATLARGGA